MLFVYLSAKKELDLEFNPLFEFNFSSTLKGFTSEQAGLSRATHRISSKTPIVINKPQELNKERLSLVYKI